jgi:hypothetical protein
MGTIIGFVIGYFLGMRDGRNGSASEISEAWDTIRKSDEFRAVLSSAPIILGQVMKQGLVMLAGRDNRS